MADDKPEEQVEGAVAAGTVSPAFLKQHLSPPN